MGGANMEIIYLTGADDIRELAPHVMALGFFDGVHLGHQRLFRQVVKHAKQLDVRSSAFTFSPHPDEVIKGKKNRKYLCTLQEKIDKIHACGIDQVFVMNFDHMFASLPPQMFIERYITGMNVQHVVVGFDFTFGFKAQGNTTLLKREGVRRGYGLSVIPKMTYGNAKIGSTETKELIADGDVEHVPNLLGKPYEVTGDNLGFDPLQNMYHIQIDQHYLLPCAGSYFVKVTTGNEPRELECILDETGRCTLAFFNEEIPTNQALKIQFLNRLVVRHAVLV
jgi:riboflavin kinase/FMN adenylyltransferase